MMALLCSLVMLLMLSGSALSFYYLSQYRADRQMAALATSIDQALLSAPPSALADWLPYALKSLGVDELEIRRGNASLFRFLSAADVEELPYGYRKQRLVLPHHPELRAVATYRAASLSEVHTLGISAPVAIAIVLTILSLLAGLHWLRRQIQPQESLEYRARRIIHGERESVRETLGEPASLTGSAIDRLLNDLAQAREQRSRVDILIRAFAARDAKTGLSNRLFFDNQLALQLEEGQEMSAHGVVMMLRAPEAAMMEDRSGKVFQSLIDLIATFVRRYPDALLARYFHGDLAVLLPHGSLKEAQSLAAQLIGALGALTGLPARLREDMLNIGICGYRKGQTVVEVMESVEQATREAALQGGNTWSVYDNRLPESVRGNVKWRTLLERTLSQGGPQLFIRPAYNREGGVDHLVVINRIIEDGQTIAADEFLPMIHQLGLNEHYDRQQLSRLIPLLQQLPDDQALAISISAESLLQRGFVVWLRNTLMQCGRTQRQKIMFELVEADVCQHLVGLRPALRLVTGLGCRLIVAQAGLTMVSTAYITAVPIAMIKLHPGLVREIDKRSENRLFVQSLHEACAGTPTRVFASGVRTESEWRTLRDHAVAGGQGDFFAAIASLDEVVKKYSRHDARLV